MNNQFGLNLITPNNPSMLCMQLHPLQSFKSCVKVSWGPLMYLRLSMSVEWKLKTSVHLSCVDIDRSVNILSGREREGQTAS